MVRTMCLAFTLAVLLTPTDLPGQRASDSDADDEAAQVTLFDFVNVSTLFDHRPATSS